MELPIGMLLRPLTVGPITIEELVEWAVVSGDGNPLHFDTHIARSQGFPDVLVSGAFKMSLVYRMLEESTGAGWRIKRLMCRNASIDTPPCTLTIEGRIERAEDGPPATRGARIRVVNEAGVATVLATAELVQRSY